MQIRKMCDNVCEGYYSWKENLICNSIPANEGKESWFATVFLSGAI